jgi:hypothetical protein
VFADDAGALNQPRTQHSRVGMLRQNNQHTPARAAVTVLAAVLRHTQAGGLEWWFFIIIKMG